MKNNINSQSKHNFTFTKQSATCFGYIDCEFTFFLFTRILNHKGKALSEKHNSPPFDTILSYFPLPPISRKYLHVTGHLNHLPFPSRLPLFKTPLVKVTNTFMTPRFQPNSMPIITDLNNMIKFL